MVMPEREMPGISAAAWAVPIAAAWRKLILVAMRGSESPSPSPGLGWRFRMLSKASSRTPLTSEEDRRRLGRGEERAQRVLERQPEDAGGNRADHQQPAEPGVGVALGDAAAAQRAPEPAEDPLPVLEEEEEEDERGGAVGGDEEGEEVVVVLVDVPAEGLGHDHGVTEAGDRKGLGEALDQAEDDRLQVRDRVHAARIIWGFP